jgi:hypothetical protein
MVNCIENLCTNNATHNYKNMKPQFCKNHIIEGMINVTKILCKEKNCTKRASCGDVNNKYQYCTKHKQDEMFNFQVNM